VLHRNHPTVVSNQGANRLSTSSGSVAQGVTHSSISAHTRDRSGLMVLADIGAERFELLGPASLGALEPSAQIAERFWAQLVDADSGVEGRRGVGD